MNCYKISIDISGVVLDYRFYTMQDTIYQAIGVAESVCEDYSKKTKRNAVVSSIVLLGKSITELKD